MLSEEVIRRLQSPDISRLVVGLSGGVDSTVLLDLAIQHGTAPVVGIHVNHGLHGDADDMAGFVESLARDRGIALESRVVSVSADGSLEANARDERYAVFEQVLEPDDLLLLAHHADDQVETILFRLLRGSRQPGLTGMPQERPIGSARLFRPLLAKSRSEILSYARDAKLSWREDPTNIQTTQDRNFIRHRVLPLLESRFSGVRGNLLDAYDRDGHARQVLSDHHQTLLSRVRIAHDCLDLVRLRELNEIEILELLTTWIQVLGRLQPTGRLLQEVVRRVIQCQEISISTQALEFRQYDDRLYLLRPLPVLEPVVLPHKLASEASLTIGGGQLTNEIVEGKGLVPGSYAVRLRQGGETLRLGSSRRLKNLFQEERVPHWLRARVPLIYAGDELVATAALPGWHLPMLIADGWEVASGEAGWSVNLRLPDRIQ